MGQIKKYHPDLVIVPDERITERCYGEIANKSTSLLGGLKRWDRYREIPYSGVETVDEVYERVKSFYDEINDKDKNILVVSHCGIYRVSCCYFCGFPKSNRLGEITLGNCEYKIFE